MTRPTVQDFLDAFEQKKIRPIFNQFNVISSLDEGEDKSTLILSAGVDSKGEKCGCAITAFVDGRKIEVLKGPWYSYPHHIRAAKSLFEEESGVDWGDFVAGYDNLVPWDQNDDDYKLGAAVREALAAKGWKTPEPSYTGVGIDDDDEV